jgi:hypothetical protein
MTKYIFLRLALPGLLLLLFLMPNASKAQVELTPFGGYMFNGKVRFVQGDLKFSDEFDYGLILGIPIRHGVTAELSYTHSESKASWVPSNYYAVEFPPADFRVNINYFQIGAIKDMEIDEGFYGFGGLSLGAAYYNTTTSGISDLWRFALGLQAGLKYFFTDAIGLRLQGRMLLPIYAGGLGAYCGIGGGGSSCGVSVSGTALVIQGDLSLGLVFKLGQ